MSKLKLIMWSSKLNASDRMAFFKVPYSKKISQIRIFGEFIKDNQQYYSSHVYFKDNDVITLGRSYNSLSLAVSETLKFIKTRLK